MKRIILFFGQAFFCPNYPIMQVFWISCTLLCIWNYALASGIEPPPQKTEVMAHLLPQSTIRGSVVDAVSKSPLAGVTLKVIGKSAATSTDENGVFELSVSVNDIVEVNYIGYQSLRVTVASITANLTIEMQTDNSSLEEVLVTGYGSQRKKDLTGAVAVVNVAQLKTQPAATAVEALQGRATGVQVVNDGAPGSTPQIKIRGYSTINNNEPLYIIDGVPFEGKLSWLNQNDIETMQVLKDASAASIYGSRANNGVVIITTKTGRQGKPEISFDSYVGLQTPRPNTFPEMMSPQQVYDLNNRLGGTNLLLPEYLLAGGLGRENVASMTPADYDMSRYNYSRNPNTFYQITKANREGTNWFRELSQNAPTQSYQLSATGGGENATYAVSLGHLKQKGAIIHSGFERFNVRSNTVFKAFGGKLRLGENMQFGHTRGFGVGVNPNVAGGYMGDGSILGFAFRVQNIIPVYDEGGNFAGSRGGWGNGQNPVAMAFRGKDNVNKANMFFGNAFAEYDILDGLMFRSSFGMKYENYNGMNITYPNPEFSEGSFNNALSEYAGYNTEWTWTNTLNWRKVIDKHNINVLAGTEAIDNRSRDLSASRNGFFLLNSLDYFYLNAGTSNFGNSGIGSLGALFSIFGKVDYSFDDRFILSATVRRDGSSNFGAANQYGVFPGISGAWRLSNEEFLKPVAWISDLKLRAGYGVTGNQRIPVLQFMNRYSSIINESSYPINGTVATGIWQSDYANPDVKWEQVNALNLGIDFTLFNGDIDGAIDYYDKRTNDMLFRVPLPAAALGNARAPYVNVGSMSNKGLELALGYHYGYRQESDFKLDLAGTISRNVNRVESLAPSITSQVYGNLRDLQTTILQAGEQFGAFYGYQVVGIYQSDSDVANSPSYAGARPGGLKYADINGDGVINDADRTVIGSPHPDFIYSLAINTAYKNFDLSMFFYGSQGNQVFDATRYFTDFSVFDGAKSARLLDAWSPENAGSGIPSPALNASSFEFQSSSYYVQDASFLKLRTMQLGYNLPVKNLFGENTAVSRLRVYLGVNNVFTITKYDGLDPEVTAMPSDYPALGVDIGSYPQARQYTFGVSLGF
ncbi:SusC/RagA family TonB-linked outer membrane protein [Sphingobacterium paludis]|uniref:TonB-linked SusC/RagA family outer membrane protein n=1 Tax=Sphingobacterium paludis TaxID=1476465 RepID=A0A4R7D9I7_9SPHI|nr:TonB-dependent receptor [Sphingobacterium paludis]TDS17700.1 TonB-linked SusC/RagA family outer membrane protein [Sphingobacterium paludis]